MIYYCYGGAHSSVTAAAVHLGALGRERPPTPAELLGLPAFDRMEAEEHGRLLLLGYDRAGHAVYTLGARSAGPIVERAVRALAAAAGLDPAQLVFANTLRAVNLWMRLGGLLSRVLGLVALGRPLVVYGTRRAFPAIVSVVDRVQAALPPRAEPPREVDARPRVVYYCYGGVHTSVVAAAVHLGWLPRRDLPRPEDITALPLFDRRGGEPLGRPATLGCDRRGVLVTVVGLGPCRRFAARTVAATLRALGADPGRVLMVPVLERTGLSVRIGGILAQRLGWHRLGARLVAGGIRRSYPRIVAAVEEAEARLDAAALRP